MNSIRPLLVAAVAGGALSSAGLHLLLATPFGAMQQSAPPANQISTQQTAAHDNGRSNHSARSQQLNAVASLTPPVDDHSTQQALQRLETLAREALELSRSLEKQVQWLAEIVQQSSPDRRQPKRFFRRNHG